MLNAETSTSESYDASSGHHREVSETHVHLGLGRRGAEQASAQLWLDLARHVWHHRQHLKCGETCTCEDHF